MGQWPHAGARAHGTAGNAGRVVAHGHIRRGDIRVLVLGGCGARIREDGLIATIGYIVHEAESVWIGSSAGGMVPGFVVGYDFESGFGLVKPSMPLHGPTAPIGTAQSVRVGDAVTIAGAGGEISLTEATVVAN